MVNPNKYIHIQVFLVNWTKFNILHVPFDKFLCFLVVFTGYLWYYSIYYGAIYLGFLRNLKMEFRHRYFFLDRLIQFNCDYVLVIMG